MTPAAGPDSAVRTGNRRAVAVDMTPPFDCTMWNVPGKPPLVQRRLEPRQVAADHRLQSGIDRRRRGALELADLVQDLVRGGDVVVGPEACTAASAAALVGGIGVRH